MQTKLFVFFAFLAFCHVSNGDTNVNGGAAAAPTDDAQKVIKQLEETLQGAVDGIHGNFKAVFNQVFQPDMVKDIASTIIANSSQSLQQVEGVVQKTVQMVQENMKSSMEKIPIPDIKILQNVTQVGDTVIKTVEKLPEMMKGAVDGAFNIFESVIHGPNNPAAAPAASVKSPSSRK